MENFLQQIYNDININKYADYTIAKPTSAFLSAGPSLVPSPVTATTCLCSTWVLSIIPAKNAYTSVYTVCLYVSKTKLTSKNSYVCNTNYVWYNIPTCFTEIDRVDF